VARNDADALLEVRDRLGASAGIGIGERAVLVNAAWKSWGFTAPMATPRSWRAAPSRTIGDEVPGDVDATDGATAGVLVGPGGILELFVD